MSDTDNKKSSWNTDRIIGVVAMLIGLFTLVIFINQTNIMREQSRLAVKPRLAFGINTDRSVKTTSISLTLTNKGLGPAIIDSLAIYGPESKPYMDFREFLEESYPKVATLGYFKETSNMTRGDVIAPNETFIFYVFVIDTDTVPTLLEKLNMGEDDSYPWTTRVEYSSMYDEHWLMTDKLNDHPIELDD